MIELRPSIGNMKLLGYLWNFLIFLVLLSIHNSDEIIFVGSIMVLTCVNPLLVVWRPWCRDKKDLYYVQLLSSCKNYFDNDEYTFFDTNCINLHCNSNGYLICIIFQMVIVTIDPEFDICDSSIGHYGTFYKHPCIGRCIAFLALIAASTRRNFQTQHCVILFIFSIYLYVLLRFTIYHLSMSSTDNNATLIDLLNVVLFVNFVIFLFVLSLKHFLYHHYLALIFGIKYLFEMIELFFTISGFAGKFVFMVWHRVD